MKKIALLFIFIFSFFSSTCFAVNIEDLESPSYPTSSKDFYHYFVFTGIDDITYLYIFESSSEFTLDSAFTKNSSYTESNIKTSFSSSVNYKLYKFNGTNWTLSSSNTCSSRTISLKKLHYSSFDVYDMNGDLFYEVPKEKEDLYQTINNVSSAELINQHTRINSFFKVLAFCGVGLLALLIGVGLIRRFIKI